EKREHYVRMYVIILTHNPQQHKTRDIQSHIQIYFSLSLPSLIHLLSVNNCQLTIKNNQFSNNDGENGKFAHLENFRVYSLSYVGEKVFINRIKCYYIGNFKNRKSQN